MILYVINHCNEWHEYSSFRLIGVVSGDKVEESLKKIRKELNYSEEDMKDFIDVNRVELNDLDI